MDVTTLDVYKSSGNGIYLNVKSAREDKLLGKWLTINEVYVDGASKFDKDGNMLPEKEDKLHVKFKEIEHIFTLNKTNFNVLVEDFGTESDEWIGEAVKLRITKHSNGKDGVIIPSRKNLADEGENPPSKAMVDDKDQIKKAMKESNAVRNVVDELNNIGAEITLESILKEVKRAKDENEITKKQYIEALEVLE